MKIALIGYGKMGREIERILVERGHSIALIVDRDNTDDLTPENLHGVDAAIGTAAQEQVWTWGD